MAEKVCARYPFICELCYKEGHFEFQCSGSNKDIAGDFCDNMITPNQHDELMVPKSKALIPAKINGIRLRLQVQSV